MNILHPALSLIVLVSFGCRDATVPTPCAQKISPRLVNQISGGRIKEEHFRIVVTLSDSTGIRQDFPGITIAGPTVATGRLTADEIRRLCVLAQVRYIELAKQYFPEPNN